MKMLRFLILLQILGLAVVGGHATSPSLRVAVAQMGVVKRHEENLSKILRYTREAADAKCRVVVFPEGALREIPEPGHPDTVALLQTIREAAKKNRIYVIMGLWSRIAAGPRGFNWMVVIDSDGREIFRYEKLYDRRETALPRVFYIDGIPCNAWICADRWLRAVAELPVIEGSQVSFELSDNMKSEWVPELGWYAYVPRAIRNGVYVVFSNTAAVLPEETDRHGHSAVVDPGGRVVRAASDDTEQMLVADLKPGDASRAEAVRRGQHPVFRRFWEKARAVRAGEVDAAVSPWERYGSPAISVTVAAAQMRLSADSCANVARMEAMIAEAAGKTDVIAFPALAVTGPGEKEVLSATPGELASALDRIKSAAKIHGIYVIFGMPGKDLGADGGPTGGLTNRAWVIGPDGEVLTSYDQMAVDRPALFQAGSCPEKMWFRVKGVPAVVTVGRDALWSEIGELAAFAGAQLLFNLSCEQESGPEADVRRLQIAVGFASYLGFTVFTNAAGGSSSDFAGAGQTTIWDDLRGGDEMRAAVQRKPFPESGEVAIYASFAANCIVLAGKGDQTYYATRTVNAQNPFREDSFNPRMRPWYWFGARTITSCFR